MQAYTLRMLGMRLLYGVIGAAVFYFLIRSGIVGGDAFPKLAVTPATGSDQCADLAKLLVWSFIAGFSERLVPDALERTEASAQSKDAAAKPNDPATKPPNK